MFSTLSPTAVVHVDRGLNEAEVEKQEDLYSSDATQNVQKITIQDQTIRFHENGRYLF